MLSNVIVGLSKTFIYFIFLVLLTKMYFFEAQQFLYICILYTLYVHRVLNMSKWKGEEKKNE